MNVGGIIKSVVTENRIIRTAIHFGSGKYFYAAGHKDKSIIIDEYQTSTTRNSNIHCIPMNTSKKVNYEESEIGKDVEDLVFKKMTN